MKLSAIQKSILALYEHDLPLAYQALALAYRHPDWQIRDLVVAGLHDILDIRLYEQGKKPSIAVLAEWEPATFTRSNRIAPARLLMLLDGFLQRAVVQANTIPEQRYLQALRDTVSLVEKILLYDPHELVRFSAFLVLNDTLGMQQRHFILSTLQQAAKQEKHPALSAALREVILV